jgi:signal transduction histidine kinase/phage shock protein PspC (stress-responsive transcriptional regulator)
VVSLTRPRRCACDDGRVSLGGTPAPQPVQQALHRPVQQPPVVVRPREGRIVGGVAAGLAEHLRLPVRVVRTGFVLTGLLSGFGVVLYVWVWAFSPEEGAEELRPPLPAGTARAAAGRWRSALGSAEVPLGALLLIGGLVLVGAGAGLPFRPQVVIPVLVVLAGTVLAFRQLDEVDRSRWTLRTTTRSAVLQVAGGLALVLVGVLLLVARGSDPVLLGRTLVVTTALLGGALLVLGPWGVRLWRNLDGERAARVREAERADIAAHLHDSVLQTLALIQRRSADPAEVARLARAQERDLRSWLYTGEPVDPSTLAARLTEAAAQVEDTHGVVVEVVTVGDRPVDQRGGALLGALREAMTNAAVHAGGPVRVYLECGTDGVEAFVRDRGKGFDPDTVPDDRHGVRESVIGRMERNGGTAEVVSGPGEGTEIRLRMPDRPEEGAS